MTDDEGRLLRRELDRELADVTADEAARRRLAAAIAAHRAGSATTRMLRGTRTPWLAAAAVAAVAAAVTAVAGALLSTAVLPVGPGGSPPAPAPTWSPPQTPTAGIGNPYLPTLQPTGVTAPDSASPPWPGGWDTPPTSGPAPTLSGSDPDPSDGSTPPSAPSTSARVTTPSQTSTQ